MKHAGGGVFNVLGIWPGLAWALVSEAFENIVNWKTRPGLPWFFWPCPFFPAWLGLVLLAWPSFSQAA